MSQTEIISDRKTYLISTKKVFEIIIKPQKIGKNWKFEPKEVIIDGKKFSLNTDKDFDQILKSMKKKLDVLQYINEKGETYNRITEEVLLDMAKIMYKLWDKQTQ